jgi:CheY-like chemotaxis protein
VHDLVLMDCQLPGLDGFGATTAVREHERTHGTGPVPIIAMTANAMEGDRERCLAAGMDDYMSKPVRIDALERTLRKWLAAGGGMSAAA